MSICIFASKLAIITGHNPYQNLDEYVVELWQKNFPRDYDEHLKAYENRECVEIIQQTPEETLVSMAKANNIDISKCLEAKDTQALQQSQKEIIKNFSEKKIPTNDLETIKKCVKQVGNTNFGTKNEVNTLKKYNTDEKKNIKTTQKFFKKSIFKTRNFEWLIGGKIDGLDEDEDTIIEFKNRVNRLFYKLRDYEKVQTMTYMYLLDKSKSRLVESLKGRGETKMNVIEVSWDQDFWDNEIVSNLKKFAKRFEKLMKSSDEKQALIAKLFSS